MNEVSYLKCSHEVVGEGVRVVYRVGDKLLEIRRVSHSSTYPRLNQSFMCFMWEGFSQSIFKVKPERVLSCMRDRQERGKAQLLAWTTLAPADMIGISSTFREVWS